MTRAPGGSGFDRRGRPASPAGGVGGATAGASLGEGGAGSIMASQRSCRHSLSQPGLLPAPLRQASATATPSDPILHGCCNWHRFGYSRGWEGATSKLLPDPAFTGHYEEDEFALAFARIEVHYFVNKGFFEADDQLLRDASRIRHIPGVIVQGRYDVVCPMESAWALHRAWPEADLIITPDSGHSAHPLS